MTSLFEVIDHTPTPLGDLCLRRRRVLALDIDVLEVKLGEEFLMSSMFTAGERALADLGLEAVIGEPADVLVGGLGLGYTAEAALGDARVRSLIVLEALEPVMRWHRQGLVPLGRPLVEDARCTFRHADFFAFMAGEVDPPTPRFNAILLDIDHSPRALLNERNRRFYSADGLRGAVGWLKPGGVFAMWSDDGPDEAFQARLSEVFPWTRTEVVEFENPLQDKLAANTIYLARH